MSNEPDIKVVLELSHEDATLVRVALSRMGFLDRFRDDYIRIYDYFLEQHMTAINNVQKEQENNPTFTKRELQLLTNAVYEDIKAFQRVGYSDDFSPIKELDGIQSKLAILYNNALVAEDGAV